MLDRPALTIRRVRYALALVALLGGTAAEGGQSADRAPGAFGPPAPLAPAVIARDGNGAATIRATPVAAPLRIDGRLDEEAYVSVQSMSDFIRATDRGATRCGASRRCATIAGRTSRPSSPRSRPRKAPASA